MQETRWTGTGENQKASNPDNWDNGIPDKDRKITWDGITSDSIEIEWDLTDESIEVEVPPSNVSIIVDQICIVDGDIRIPKALRDIILLSQMPPEYFLDRTFTIEEWNNKGPGWEPIDRAWYYNGTPMLPFFGVNADGSFSFNTTYTSSGTGDWDNVATWGGGGFPAITDIAIISNTHVVSVKGGEACLSFTVNLGGTLRLDGQTDTANASLTCSNGSTSTNNGTIDQIGTGTKYARINGVAGYGAHIITGSQPTFGSGHWYFGSGTHFDMAITTGAGGCYIAGLVSSHNLTIESSDSLDSAYAYGFITLNDGSLPIEGFLVIYYSDGIFTDNRISQVPQVYDFRINPGVTTTLGNHATLQQIDIQGIFDLNNFNLALTNSATMSTGVGIFLYSTGEYIKGTGSLTITSPNGGMNDFLWSSKTPTDDFGAITYTSDHDFEIQSDITITSLSLNGAGTFFSGDDALTIRSNVTIANGFSWTHGTGTIEFNVTTTYTDNNATAQDIGDIYISGTLTLANAKPIHFKEIEIDGTFTSSGANVITCDGQWTCTVGTFVYSQSHVHFTATALITGMVGLTNGFYDLTIDLGAIVTTDSYVSVSGTKTVTGTDNRTGTTSSITHVYNDLTITGTMNSKLLKASEIKYTGSKKSPAQSPYQNMIHKGGS
ncbi:hypothetical protein [Sulfuricurvum sp.]|uniref:hypothetical protein n=1 Tax=Sulfuricurvum sp. TaxID=2025608 RepID=UPI0035643070